ncbi:ATP-binding protein [Streptomyces sp. MRC013]|uniref:sensor histidine kinase n=1 Tax=Streptomyces sp. MRC013 TaxID=2898276 RepID=UPI002026E93A|nr:ATP-binding protein [Streptomyces sp. MRC013]URM88981.1 ATP-binding protein [Streptomyces sp. MRC013]
MSPLRAPLARPGRRDGGGRHGRPGARPLPHQGGPHPTPLPPEARIRPRLLRACVPPAAAAVLGGTVAVLFTLHSTGARPTAALWTVLGCAAALAAAAVTAAVLGADRAARSVLDRCNALRRATARRQDELHGVVERLRRGERPPVPQPPPPVPGGDDFDLLAHELGRAHDAAVATAVQASRLSSSVGHEQKVEVFVNLARRLQSLVHREIQLLDELENAVEDPELLKGLFHVDHLATRVRRHAENLAVLGGAVSRRQWSNPVTMTEVLRSSIAEVEQYPRVKLIPPIDGTLRGHAVADVIHLLAELVENATLFSAPHTTVLLRAQYVTAGLAVEVEDRGLGMPPAEQEKMNALLCDPDQVNVAHLLQDGRIGLYVVSALARRHGIAVRLQSNIYGGVQAVLVIPQELLGTDPAAAHQPGRPRPDASGGAAGAVPTGAVPAAPAPYPAHDRPPAAADARVPPPRRPRHAAPRPGAGRGTRPPGTRRTPRPAVPAERRRPVVPRGLTPPRTGADPVGPHRPPAAGTGRPRPPPPARPRAPRAPAPRRGPGTRPGRTPPAAQAARPGAPRPAAARRALRAPPRRPPPARPGADGGVPARHRPRRGRAAASPVPPVGPAEPQRHDEAHKE